MEITIVGEAAIPAKGGAKAPGSQAGSDGFDMAMAAVMALLMPNSGDSPPAQNVIAEGTVYSEDVAFPSGENINSQKAAGIAPQQGFPPGATPAVDAVDAARIQAQVVNVEEVQQPPGPMVQNNKNPSPVPGISAEPVLKQSENSETRENPVIPASPAKGPLSIEAAGRSPLFAGAAEPGAGQEKTETVPSVKNININAEGDTVWAAPPGLGSSPEKPAPDKAAAGMITPGSNAQAAAAKTNIAAENGQERGAFEAARAEGKVNVMPAGTMEAGGAAPAGEAKNESGGFNNSPGDAFQPDPAQINATGNLPGSSKNLKAVSLPDLKDVVVREIKHIYETRRGEPTQIQLQLEPENLGKLTIKLSYSNGELNAHFYTGSDHVKEILEGAIGQLRESLGQQELTLNQAFVFVGDENRGGDGSQAEFGNRQPEFFPDKHSGGNFPQSKMEPDNYYRLDNGLSGINYLI
ncbi:flagellar hook-length control protein FliK [Pelotomaculum propionicicum]|uniref:flagellar hook-length control protein FliK n=1 Tax=Pelotomaculum propionicicum TaxID=258475 RepID=UPI003B7E71CC